MKRISTSLAAAAIGGIAMPIGQAPAQAPDLPTQIVDAQHALAGKGKTRVGGAKGQCFVGTFEPTADARKLSKSAIFAKPSRVLARFSVGGGNPKVADGSRGGNRGFAFRIDAGGKGQTEFVMINAPVNFVKSPEQMLGFLQARLPGADGKPDAEKIKAFTEANPETTAQGKWLASKPIPGSWVGVTYWGVHGYTLTSAANKTQVVKFKMVPKAGQVALTDDEAKAKPADFLADELAGRVTAKGETAFDMVAVLAKPGDATNDATKLWADEEARPTVRLATLRITGVEKNEVCDATYFDPTKLAAGISGPKDDPLFAIRQPAYATALEKRQ